MDNDRSGHSGQRPKRLRPAGGYRSTASFQTAPLIYHAAWWFRKKFHDPRSRTVDQMLQAARSGRHSIAEGSRFAATPSQTELRLVNAARSNLEEPLLDFEDYLRHRHLPQWAPDGPEARAVREVAWHKRTDQPHQTDLTDLTDQQRWALYARWLEHADPAIRANASLCLIHQANYLLDQHIAALEQAFIEEGGYSEHLAAARLAERERQRKEEQTDRADRNGSRGSCSPLPPRRQAHGAAHRQDRPQPGPPVLGLHRLP